jgi:hypothetical protein
LQIKLFELGYLGILSVNWLNEGGGMLDEGGERFGAVFGEICQKYYLDNYHFNDI